MKDYWYVEENGTWQIARKENGDIDLATGKTELAQRIVAALTLILGEWSFDTTKGIPIFGEILTKGFKNVAVNYIKTTLLSLTHVKTVKSPTIAGIADRHASMKTTVQSDFGEVTVNETVM